jgi:hypothetical protein
MEGEAITVYMNESHDMFPLLTSPFLLPEAGNSVKHPDWPLSAPMTHSCSFSCPLHELNDLLHANNPDRLP